MTDITIPPEALAEARTAAEKVYGTQFFTEEIEAACLAMLKAWPRSYSLAENDSAVIRVVAAIILPLPQEPRDE